MRMDRLTSKFQLALADAQSLAVGAFHGRNAANLFEQARAQETDVDAGAIEQWACAAALLVEECDHQVDWLDELVVAAIGQRLRVLQRHLKLGREPVHSHAGSPYE